VLIESPRSVGVGVASAVLVYPAPIASYRATSQFVSSLGPKGEVTIAYYSSFRTGHANGGPRFTCRWSKEKLRYALFQSRWVQADTPFPKNLGLDQSSARRW
jgi:hypothetical protein